MSEDVNVTVNTNESPMDMWFKESMEAYDNMLKSAEKLYKKGEKKDDTVG